MKWTSCLPLIDGHPTSEAELQCGSIALSFPLLWDACNYWIRECSRLQDYPGRVEALVLFLREPLYPVISRPSVLSPLIGFSTPPQPLQRLVVFRQEI